MNMFRVQVGHDMLTCVNTRGIAGNGFVLLVDVEYNTVSHHHDLANGRNITFTAATALINSCLDQNASGLIAERRPIDGIYQSGRDGEMCLSFSVVTPPIQNFTVKHHVVQKETATNIDMTIINN